MAGLALLIRLSRQVAEERQISLGQVTQAHAEAVAATVEHEMGVAAECQIAANDLDALAALGRWASEAARRGKVLQRRRSDLAHSEVAARGALHDAFIDLKRLELVLDTVQETAACTSRRRADLLADEREQIRRGGAGAA
jgi:hypothetical protein